MPAPLPETPVATPPPLPETARLPRWQYRVINNPDFTTFRDFGREGWELVSVTTSLATFEPNGIIGRATSVTTAYFKRQLVD